MKNIWLASAILLLGVSAPQAQEDDVVPPPHNSVAFAQSFDAAVAKLGPKFDAELQGPRANSMSNDEFNSLRQKIHDFDGFPGVSAGEAGGSYDIILQPGHYRRTSDKTGTSGTLVSEQQLAAFIVGEAAKQLRGRGLKVLVVPADGAAGGIKATVFLAVHADGSSNPCKTGPSLAYDTETSPLAMHVIGWGLSQAMGYAYKKPVAGTVTPANFRPDNYTADEGHYYMFGRVKAKTLKGLLEVGELTCPAIEKRLISNSQSIARNLASGLTMLMTPASGD